jgi:hypothetical protein
LIDRCTKNHTQQFSRVEEFKKQEGLKPTGLLCAINDNGVFLIDFDEAQDKKNNWAHVQSHLEMQNIKKAWLSEDQVYISLWCQDELVVVKFAHFDGNYQL